MNVDGVVDDIHFIVHLGSLTITAQSFVDFGALLSDTYLNGLVVGVGHHTHTLVVERQCLIVESLFSTEFSPVVKPHFVQQTLIVEAALLHLVEHDGGHLKFVLAEGSLCTCLIVVGPPIGCLTFLVLNSSIIFCQEIVPLVTDIVDLIVVLLYIENIHIICEDVRELQRLLLHLHQKTDTSLVRVCCLLDVIHVGIHVTHGEVGQSHAISVIPLVGIVVHRLYLLQGRIGLSGECIGVNEQRPCLVIVLPLLNVTQELE